MISYLHFPILVICSVTLIALYRWWWCIDRMGFTREVSRRAPDLIHGDVLVAVFTIMPFFIAVVDWFGITLPRQQEPLSPGMAVFMSVACMGACVFAMRNSGDRLAGHWAGTRESALRTVAALRIIDAAELTYALDRVQEFETAMRGAGRTIDIHAEEVRK